jgi:hypothetical protein
MGLRPTQGDEKRLLFSNYSLGKRPLSPLVIPTGAQRSGEPALSEVEWGPAVSPASMGLSCPLHNLDKSAQRVVTVIR